MIDVYIKCDAVSLMRLVLSDVFKIPGESSGFFSIILFPLSTMFKYKNFHGGKSVIEKHYIS